MSWTTYDEPIELIERRFQYFPRAFRWRGRRYDVDSVEHDWTAPRPPSRRYFRVQCMAGTVELCHDLEANLWHLRRVRWTARDVKKLFGRRSAPRLAGLGGG